MWTKINYIPFNPLRSQLILKPQAYIYSSASNYFINKLIVDIEFVQIKIVDYLKSNSLMNYNIYN